MKQHVIPETPAPAHRAVPRHRLAPRRSQEALARQPAGPRAIARAIAPHLTVLALACVALALRIWGVGWSLPYMDHPDEPAVMGVILSIVSGDLNPGAFFYPSLVFYMQAALLKLHFWLGLGSGLYPDTGVLTASHHGYTTAPQAFIWARALTAVLGSATALALFLRGRRYLGHRAALLGALLLACSPWAVAHSHYLTVDTPATLFGTLALLACIPVLVDGCRRDYLVAGLLLGLAAACKYQNGLLAATLLAAHVLGRRRQSLARAGALLLAGALAALVFFLSSPYLILDNAGFLRDMRTLVSSYDGSHGDLRGSWPIGGYLSFLWTTGLGPAVAALTLVGIVTMAWRRPALCVVLLCFPVLLLLSLLQVKTHFFRNLLPAQPALLLLAGYGAVSLWGELMTLATRGRARDAQQESPTDAAAPDQHRALGRERLLRLTGWAGALALVALSLGPAVRESTGFASPDSRVVAQEWARASRPGARIASEIAQPLRWNGNARQSSFADYLPLHPPGWYRRQGFGLLLASSYARNGEAWSADYQLLRERTTLIASFGGEGSGLRGPRIDLFDTGLSEATLPDDQPQAEVGPLMLRGASIGPLVEDAGRWERLPGRQLRPGQVLGVTTYWSAPSPTGGGSYTFFLHVRDAQGQTVTQLDRPFWHGLFPAESWPRDRIMVDQLELSLPQTLAPGSYQLVLGLYDSTVLTRYALIKDGRRMPNDELVLGNITVANP